MWKIIVLMGAPGAGKGTQARLLEERLHLPQISTGDILRALKDSPTELAEQVRQIMEAGQLVPDDFTIRLVRERTVRDDCKHGYVLDGFPRTSAQAVMLDGLALEQAKRIQAIFIDVPHELLEKRLTGRRKCPVCGEIYNVFLKPPRTDNVCDLHPSAQLEARADDNPETVRARLAAYEAQTLPLIEYYKTAHLLCVVDGSRDAEAIYKDIEKLVTSDE